MYITVCQIPYLYLSFVLGVVKVEGTYVCWLRLQHIQR